MELTQFTLLALGFIYSAAGIAVLFGTLNFKDLADDLEKSPALIFICGAVAAVIGLALVINHNLWILSPAVIVTLFGWGMLAGGVLIIVWPRSIGWAARFYIHSKLWGVVMLVAGLVCLYLCI